MCHQDVGLGTPESRAGEAVTHKTMRLLKEGRSEEEIRSELMKIAKTGIIKRQNASRNISRITKKINSL